MATPVATAVADSLKMDRDEKGIRITELYRITGCTGATQKDMLASALGATGLPTDGTTFTANGVVLYLRSQSFAPWGTDEAECTVTFQPPDNSFSPTGSGASFSIGTSLEQTESDFSATERAKVWTMRTPLFVNDPTGTSGLQQPMRLPYYAQRSTFQYVLREAVDPGARSRTYSGRRNSATWKGLGMGTVMCLGIAGQSNDGGVTFSNTYQFGYDPDDFWNQVGRWKNRDGTFPALTNSQAASRFGIQDVNMQGDVDFSLLPV